MADEDAQDQYISVKAIRGTEAKIVKWKTQDWGWAPDPKDAADRDSFRSIKLKDPFQGNEQLTPWPSTDLTSNGPPETIKGRLEHPRGQALEFRNLTI